MGPIVKCDVVFLCGDYGVYAVFPDQVCSVTNPNEITAYNGGHFGVLVGDCYEDKEATDYTDLFNKMTLAGYELTVVSKESLIEYQKQREANYNIIKGKK